MTHPDRFLLAGVMGWPVMHSRSPALHNYWLAKHGLAGSYLPPAIKQDGLRAALRALPALGFAGCNLTIPHKEAALDIVDKLDPVARRIGAMNCVVWADGSLQGYNHTRSATSTAFEAKPDWRADLVRSGDRRRRRRRRAASLIDRGAREIRLVNCIARAVPAGIGRPIRGAMGDRRGTADAAMLVNTTNQGWWASRWSLRSTACRLARWCRISSTSARDRLLAAARARQPHRQRARNAVAPVRPAFRAWSGSCPR